MKNNSYKSYLVFFFSNTFSKLVVETYSLFFLHTNEDHKIACNKKIYFRKLHPKTNSLISSILNKRLGRSGNFFLQNLRVDAIIYF